MEGERTESPPHGALQVSETLLFRSLLPPIKHSFFPSYREPPPQQQQLADLSFCVSLRSINYFTYDNTRAFLLRVKGEGERAGAVVAGSAPVPARAKGVLVPHPWLPPHLGGLREVVAPTPTAAPPTLATANAV